MNTGTSEETKTCPFCAEEIKAEAHVCKHCGTNLDETMGEGERGEHGSEVGRCPKCKSSQLTAQKKGFGLGKAVAGGVLTGGVGLLAGFVGSGKVKVTCLKCGHSWIPGT